MNPKTRKIRKLLEDLGSRYRELSESYAKASLIMAEINKARGKDMPISLRDLSHYLDRVNQGRTSLNLEMLSDSITHSILNGATPQDLYNVFYKYSAHPTIEFSRKLKKVIHAAYRQETKSKT